MKLGEQTQIGDFFRGHDQIAAHAGDDRLQAVGMPFRNIVAGFEQFHDCLDDRAAGTLASVQLFPVHVVVGALKDFPHRHGRSVGDCVADRQADGGLLLPGIDFGDFLVDSRADRLYGGFLRGM